MAALRCCILGIVFPTCIPGRASAAKQESGEPGSRREILGLESFCSYNIRKKVAPSRVRLLDDLDFPIPAPAFHRPLASCRSFRIAMLLEIDEAARSVTLRETFEYGLSMLL